MHVKVPNIESRVIWLRYSGNNVDLLRIHGEEPVGASTQIMLDSSVRIGSRFKSMDTTFTVLLKDYVSLRFRAFNFPERIL